MKNLVDRLCSDLRGSMEDMVGDTTGNPTDAGRPDLAGAAEVSRRALQMAEVLRELAMCLLVLITIQELVREEVPATDVALATRLLVPGDIGALSPN